MMNFDLGSPNLSAWSTMFFIRDKLWKGFR